MERPNNVMKFPLATHPVPRRKHPEIPHWARGTSHFCVPVNNTYDAREDGNAPQKERTKGTRLKSSRMGTSRWKRQALACAVLVIFAIQTYVAILAATPPQPTTPSPAQGRPPTEFAFLNHTPIVEDEDGYWEVWANGSIYLIAEKNIAFILQCMIFPQSLPGVI